MTENKGSLEASRIFTKTALVFVENYHLEEMKTRLWAWVGISNGKKFRNLPPDEQIAFVQYYERLENLLIVMYASYAFAPE